MLNLSFKNICKTGFSLSSIFRNQTFRFFSMGKRVEGTPSLNLEFEDILKLGFKQKTPENYENLSDSQRKRIVEAFSNPNFSPSNVEITPEELRNMMIALSLGKASQPQQEVDEQVK